MQFSAYLLIKQGTFCVLLVGFMNKNFGLRSLLLYTHVTRCHTTYKYEAAIVGVLTMSRSVSFLAQAGL